MGRPPKYPLTLQRRNILLERYDSRPATIKALMAELEVPRPILYRWARELGLTRQHADPWTPEEDTYLEEYGGRVSWTVMQRRLGRSCESIKYRMAYIGATKLQAGYTAKSLAEALGCSEHVVGTWLARGLLRGTKRKSERTEAQGGDFWLITEQQFVDFLLKHGELVQARWDRPRWLWLLSMLRGGRKILKTPDLEDEAS